MKIEYIIDILTGKRKAIDVWHYIVGNYRYKIYYSKYDIYLLRQHILEQIGFRITSMDNECLMNGSCKLCGCTTTKLQMANKSCDKPCYPEMMNSIRWNKFKKDGVYKDSKGIIWYKDIHGNPRQVEYTKKEIYDL